MSEEMVRASHNVPRAITIGVLMNGALGFGMLVAALFCIGDVTAVLATPTGYPFLAIFQGALGSSAGTLGLAMVFPVINMIASVSFTATASRMTWSFARDQGTPFWSWLKHIEPRTQLPLRAIVLTLTISVLSSLIVLGSSVAFNDFVSLSIAGLYASYLIGNSLLLWRRFRGHISSYNPDSQTLRNTTGADELVWGPWKIPEPMGTINNIFGCLYLLIMLFFSFWPTTAQPTAASMNYSSLMFGATIIFAVVYYLLHGHKVYIGPIIETHPGQS